MTVFTSKFSRMNFSSVICKSRYHMPPSPAVLQLPSPQHPLVLHCSQSLSTCAELIGPPPRCLLPLSSGCLRHCCCSICTSFCITLQSEKHFSTWPEWAIWPAFPWDWNFSKAFALNFPIDMCLHVAAQVTRTGPKAMLPANDES